MCAFFSTNAGNLKQHILVHTGKKPFSCKQCEYKCTTNYNLKKHMFCHIQERRLSLSYSVSSPALKLVALKYTC